MHFQSKLIREISYHLSLLALILLTTLGGYQSRWPLVVTANDELPQAFEGFHQVEQSDQGAFRWTNGSGEIRLEQVGAATLRIFSLTLLGQGAVPLGINEVTLFDKRELAFIALPLYPQKRFYHVLLSQKRSNDDFWLTLASQTVKLPNDPRLLGVPWQGFRLQNPTVSLVRPAIGQFLLNLALAFLLFWAFRLACLSALHALLLISFPTITLSFGLFTGIIPPGIGLIRSLVPIIGTLTLILVLLLGKRFSNWAKYSLLIRDFLAIAFWSFILWAAIALMQEVHGHHGVWPLKAGIWPGFTPLVIIPLLFFSVWLALILIYLQKEKAFRAVELGIILFGAIALPILLKTSVRGWDSLFLTFRNNPSDYIHDVPLVKNPISFLGQYVALSPTLAWHNSNHPPGSVLLLWLVERLFGAGFGPATWVAIVLSSLGVLAAYWFGSYFGGRKIGLLAGAMLVVMPGYQVYSVTSMDGIFNAVNAWAAMAFLLALEPNAQSKKAMLAGFLLSIGLFFTYATTQIFFFGLTVVILALLRQKTYFQTFKQAGIVAFTLSTSYLLLYCFTGFNILQAALQATANNARVFATEPSLAFYVYFLGVNLPPFACYLAPWGLTAIIPQVQKAFQNYRQHDSLDILAISIVVLVAGMWLSGLFIRETERIWGFTYPLFAVLLAHYVWQGQSQNEKIWRAGLYLTLFFAQSVVFRTFLNTYW